MRVVGATANQGRGEAPRSRFGDALRRAERRDERACDERAGRRPAERRTPPVHVQRKLPACPEPPEEGRAAPRAEPGWTGAPVDLAPVPELAALARALPVAIATARVRDGVPLALSFGRSLDVELRSGTAGVELLLRPEPRLLHAARAELPRVVAALRLRGVAVASADVRGRESPPGRAR